MPVRPETHGLAIAPHNPGWRAAPPVCAFVQDRDADRRPGRDPGIPQAGEETAGPVPIHGFHMSKADQPPIAQPQITRGLDGVYGRNDRRLRDTG